MTDSVLTVPVVRGSGPYKDILPPMSYIDAADFATTKELADYLLHLDQNDHLYHEYFTWRKQYQCLNMFSDRQWPCLICDAICKLKHSKIRKTLDDMRMFHVKESCYFPKTFDDSQLFHGETVQ